MYDFDPKKDYYKILGVPEGASKEDIKKAFKKMAIQHHPDKAGGDKAKFQEMNEAFQVLGDDKKRQQYDMMKKGGFGGDMGGFGGFGGGGGGGFDFGDFDIGDLVGNMFGGGFSGGRGGQGGGKGEDVKVQITLTFEEAFLGVEKKISYTRSMMMKGVDKKTCPTCGGRGSVMQKVQTPFGVMQTQAGCHKCHGSGNLFTKDGKELGDNGLERQKEIVSAKVPAGIKDGVYLKYQGKGNENFSNIAGDLYIKINITPSKNFYRKGDDLYTRAEVSMFDMVLGGQCEISHPEGKLKIKIPKGTQIGELIKVSGKGFGEGGVFSSKGSMYIEPQVSIPKRLSKEEEKLWNELKEVSGK